MCVCHYFIHVHLIMQRNQITSVIMTSCMASRDGTKQITTSITIISFAHHMKCQIYFDTLFDECMFDEILSSKLNEKIETM